MLVYRFVCVCVCLLPMQELQNKVLMANSLLKNYSPPKWKFHFVEIVSICSAFCS